MGHPWPFIGHPQPFLGYSGGEWGTHSHFWGTHSPFWGTHGEDGEPTAIFGEPRGRMGHPQSFLGYPEAVLGVLGGGCLVLGGTRGGILVLGSPGFGVLGGTQGGGGGVLVLGSQDLCFRGHQGWFYGTKHSIFVGSRDLGLGFLVLGCGGSRFWGAGGVLTQLGTGEVDGPANAEQRHLGAALLQREVLSNLHILGGNWGVLESKAPLFWGVGMGCEEGNGNKPQRPQICVEMGSQTQQN